MPKWVNSTVLDNGLNNIVTNASTMALISTYTTASTYAQVSSWIVAQVAMTTGDYPISSSGANRLITTATKSATATVTTGAAPDLHIAFLNHTGTTVYWVTDETSNQTITSGNTVNFPAITYQSNQPT